MQYYEIAPNQIVRAGADSFTYSSPEPLKVGHIVEISVGKKLLIGVILRSTSKPSYNTKQIERIIESTPLPSQLLSLAQWMSSYYATPLAQSLQTILPRGITKNRRKITVNNSVIKLERTNFVLTKDQSSALEKLDNMHGTWLLHGVTGSGKTTVYIEQAKRIIQSNKSVVILVPEIALTSQLVSEFMRHFDNILLTHSRQTEAERHIVWKQALESTTPQIIIGPRSALFLPVKNVGMIVVDESHEPSYQQEQSPRYSALRAASKYMELQQGIALLGSATPLVSDFYLASKADRVITLPTPARQNAVKPEITTVDMTKRAHFKKHRFISDQLIQQLETTFLAGKQALIFHNRRGSASSTLCENCGWQAGCPRCYIPLTLHADSYSLRCHICDSHSKVPTSCPECGHTNIIHKGIGTKLIESELRKLFPKQHILRFDADTKSDETVEQQFEQLQKGSIDLIIGTQVVAKGLDLPQLRTVGVIQADAGLSLPDYSSAERTFQLLSQVIGRVGRSEHETSVIIQSYQPEHSVVVDGIKQNYADFYARTLKLRQHTSFPPFTYLLQLTCVYKTEAAAIKNAKNLALHLHQNKNIEVLGPTPAFYERTRDTYRWQLVIKSAKRQHLLDVLHELPPKNWQFELDPISLL
jgi:primosomal protein N' (replication factor Y)